MKRRLTILIVTASVILALISSALAEDTCPSVYVLGDWAIWNDYPYLRQQYSRDALSSFYNLQKRDWDEGWGWVKYNDNDAYLYGLPKMMYAGWLLMAGLDYQLSVQGNWSAHSIYHGPEATEGVGTGIVALARRPDVIDVLFRDYLGGLRQVSLSGNDWYPGQINTAQTVTAVSDLLANEKNRYRISSDPSVSLRNAEAFDVVARGGRELLHFSWTSTNGWNAMLPTQETSRPATYAGSDRYFVSGTPVVLRRLGGTLDVLIMDDLKHLIHYWLAPGSPWAAEDVTALTGTTLQTVGDPVVVSPTQDRLEAFALTDLGHLIHFGWQSASGWSIEDLTQIYGPNYQLGGSIAAIVLGESSLHVFGRGRESYNFIHYFSNAPGSWNVENLTQRLGNLYLLDSKPVLLSRSPDDLDLFGQDLNHNLIQLYWRRQSGWGGINLSQHLGGAGLVGDVAVTSPAENRIDVFGRSLGNYLWHYYWYRPTGWMVEDATLNTANSSPTVPPCAGDIAVTTRQKSALDILCVVGPSRLAHYAAATGLTVNSWHTNTEYSNWASGALHDFKYTPKDTNDPDEGAANARRSWILSDRAQFNCPAFRHSPALRAADMLHEATHMNYWNSYSEHQTSPTGNDADDWIFHTVRDPSTMLDDGIIATGWGTGYVIVTDHSPYQVTVEYLADIAEFPRDDLPLSVYLDAYDAAVWFMNNSILNPPGWVPGTPRPLP